MPSTPRRAADVVVLDTIGELARLYQLATVVFVGGSLVDAGGHNILEPAMFGKPIVFGPHMPNFAEIAEEFLRHNARRCRCYSTRELGETLVALVGDPVRRASLGAGRARAGREQPRREGAHARRHRQICCRRATARPPRRRDAVPRRPVSARP